MLIKTDKDDLLKSGLGLALGKLLVAFQYLEQNIWAMVESSELLESHWKAMKIAQLRGGTAARCLEDFLELLKEFRLAHKIPDASYTGMAIFEIFEQQTEEERDAAVALSFASAIHLLGICGDLLQYRNNVIHGRLKMENGVLRFVGKKGCPVVSPEILDRKRQEVLNVAFQMALQGGGMYVSLNYLMHQNV